MNTKNVLIGLGVIVLLVLGVTFPRGNSVVQQIVGATAGPDDTNPYHSLNGVEQWNYSTKFNKASTTLCSFKSPAATSTLTFASLNISTATTTVTVYDIAKSVSPAATTTKLANTITLGSLAKATIVASSTSADVESNFVFGPNTYLNFKFGGTQGDTNVLVGDCKAIFIKN